MKIKNFSEFIKYLNESENESKKLKMPIPDDIKKIAYAFKKHGKDIYIVGGAVRDFINGKTPHDFDLATNAQLNDIKNILKDWDVSDEQGKSFGVVRVYTKDEPNGYEIATFRKDIAKGRDTKGNNKKVEIGDHITIFDDVKRRDLTINALFYDINKEEIVDIVGGVKDINNKIIRMVGDPKDRINEDRLRILRVFRFAARSNSKIDRETELAIKKDNRIRDISNIDDVSQERILEEWNKMLEHAQKDNNPKMMQRYIDLLIDFDLLEQMFPNMNINKNIKIKNLNNAIIFYKLFINNDLREKRKYLISKLKFTIDLTNELLFIDLYLKFNDDINYVYKLAKFKKSYNINDELIYTIVDEFNLDLKLFKAFIKYLKDGFSVRGDELIKLGFKSHDIEIEKEKREINIFKNKYI